jgi:hypothetical protein
MQQTANHKQQPRKEHSMKSKIASRTVSTIAAILATLTISAVAGAEGMKFPEGTATPSETCGGCHKAIYNEFAHGFGADIRFKDITLKFATENKLNLPAGVSDSATAHAFAGVDPFPVHARDVEEGGKSCNVCHYPEAFAIPNIDTPEMTKPKPRTKNLEQGGLTCASCHLTPEGKIRAAHDVKAPHETVTDPAIQTSAMCAYCHSMGNESSTNRRRRSLSGEMTFSRRDLESSIARIATCQEPNVRLLRTVMFLPEL